MQLTCPNCSARYLVDPAAIGPSGRTVQCFRCGHKWPAASPAPAKPVIQLVASSPPAPDADFNIHPEEFGHAPSLPALIDEPGMPSWLRVVLGFLIAIAIVGGASYLFHDDVVPVLAIDQHTARIARSSGDDGKIVIVVTGEIVNAGQSAMAATKLHLMFKDAQGKLIEQRAVPISTGGIPPNGRARFETRVDDTPAQSTVLDLSVE
jgi:predicted Zn finger-like uncharacterized protein